MNYVLKDATIINGDASISTPQDILIENGSIVRIAPQIQPGDAEVVNCAGRYVSPGFANLHTHSPMHMLRGLAEDVNIDDWFNEQIWPYESKITPEDIYYGTRLACYEMIDNGVTVFADHYFAGDTVLVAVQEAGLRTDFAVTAFGLDIEQDIQETLQLLTKFTSDKIKVRFGPHSPYLVDPTALKQLVDAAREAKVGIHIHASETAVQEQQSLEKYGKRHFEIISEAGGFSIPCIIAHGRWATDADFTLVGADTFVAACPKTYCKLGGGMGHLWENWQDKNLCIGTDGAASSNSLRPLEQARWFALCGKLDDRAADYRIEDIWRMLMNGHNALDFQTGNLAEGAPADLLIWNLDMPSTAPVYNPLAAILYSAEAGNITHTMVQGQFLKKEGVLVGDVANTLAEAERCAKALYQRGKGDAKISF